MGLIDRLAQSAARITSSPRRSGSPARNGYSNVDTDPRLWRAPAAPQIPLPNPPQPFSVDATLQRWFQQIRQERGNMHVMLRRMADERPEFTAVYLRMRELGYTVRKNAGTRLNHAYGMPQTFDPYQPNYWFSDARLIYMVCELYGIEKAQMTPNERIAAMAYGDGQHAIHAYLQTFSTDQPPMLVIDFEPAGADDGDPARFKLNRRIWTHYAACCLAKYLYDIEIYHGRGAPMEVIAPFDPRKHASFIPLAHSFAKGLLYLENDCPEQWVCGCNGTEAILRQRPEEHPYVTGELPGDVVRAMAYEQGYEPAGYGYGQAAPPSRAMPYTLQRGMTPPNGTLLHEYNRRRTTDPNLRRETGH